MNTKHIFLMISQHHRVCVCVRAHVHMWRGRHKEEKKKEAVKMTCIVRGLENATKKEMQRMNKLIVVYFKQ